MDRLEARAALARRLRWLWRALAMPGVRRGLRWLGRAALVVYFVFVVLILALRYSILPAVPDHRADIEQAASAAIGMPVKIESIAASWEGLNPRLTLTGVRLQDRQGLPALAFSRVESVLSWHSLWRFQPILSLLAIDGPVLHVRRDSMGRITVAGVEAEGETDPRLAEWFLLQRHIRVRNATIVWEDAKRQAPPLILEDLQFALDNRGSRHRFGLSAVPPAHLAARLDIRGDVRGDPLQGFDKLSGKLYAELDYADLAGWRTWVDYPILMRQGRGALRAWGDWKEGEGSATADVALEDVRIKLGSDLPQLELADMRGRVAGSYKKDGWRFAGRKVELSTLNGIRIPPTDFEADWTQTSGGVSGKASANYLDLEVLQRLAGYLPLDARSRVLLATHQPRGRISELRASWAAQGDSLQRYGLQAHFDGLGMLAAGYFPGAEGLSGELEASEKGGKLVLESKESALDLPSVFPESRIALHELHAKANWKIDGKVLDARLERMEFAGPDATGSAQGSYRFSGDGPGVIDLTAAISRANGNAVWRYMPHVVNADTRNWLKRGIVSGTASDAKLTLKGDLRDFPFADKKKGEFLITAKAKDVKVDYAAGWPVIDGVEANLSFGVGMRIEANKGSILGTRLGPVLVEIPLFDASEEMLLVSGYVEGPTAEFLQFIDKSPVADNINHMTDDMRASGNGRLALKLDMPLRHVNDTRVQGEYQFQNNQLVAVPGLPAVSQVNGKINFSERSVLAPEITGYIFGAPMRLSVKNEGEKVLVAMSGGIVARELRKVFDSPVFDSISGQTTWKGEVRVRKKTAEFAIDSNLVGISSSLPEPFNKSATSALPLRLEKSAATNAPNDGQSRDQLRLHLAGVAEGSLIRRQEGDAMRIERGAVVVGGSLPALPAKGVLLALNVPRLDGDFWRSLADRSGNGAASNGAANNGPSPLSQVILKTPVLRLFGRDFNAIDINAAARDGGWQINLNAQEAAGELFWSASETGSLKANLKRLTVPAEGAASSIDGEVRQLIDSLPGLDVQVADFSLGNKRLGKLEAKAHNNLGVWHLDHLALQNPDGSLKGKGEWRSRDGHSTHLDFELAANDIGKLLERLGYPGAVRRGSASLKGGLTWDGPLTAIHYPSLSGDLSVNAEKGQFAKLEPGIGKLLGLLSLQSLPRRLSLDFRDIFSEGLAFDTIEAKLAVKNGIMRTTEDLKIDGPSARILMRGEADLKQETQDMLVTVQPELGIVAAVGAAAFAHPVIGAVALVASKLLQNPLNRMFAFQYRVTGAWADPKVEKVRQTVPPPPEPAPTANKAAAESK